MLDMGCGSGRDVYVLAQRVGESGNVLGVDVTEEQLAEAAGYGGQAKGIMPPPGHGGVEGAVAAGRCRWRYPTLIDEGQLCVASAFGGIEPDAGLRGFQKAAL
jgi:SAM-dependent methyltransferase